MNDPLQPHSHDNNESPPDNNLDILLTRPDGSTVSIAAAALAHYPQSLIPHYEYTTDHGKHGPYQLRGVALYDLIQQEVPAEWHEVEVLSADGFGNRVFREELERPMAVGPILLCTHTNGRPLGRAEGAIRLVVPSETDNALRQIKWVREIRVKSSGANRQVQTDS